MQNIFAFCVYHREVDWVWCFSWVLWRLGQGALLDLGPKTNSVQRRRSVASVSWPRRPISSSGFSCFHPGCNLYTADIPSTPPTRQLTPHRWLHTTRASYNVQRMIQIAIYTIYNIRKTPTYARYAPVHRAAELGEKPADGGGQLSPPPPRAPLPNTTTKCYYPIYPQ